MRSILEQSKDSLSLAGKVAGKGSKIVHSADPKVYGPLAGVALLALLVYAIHNKYKARKEMKEVSDDFEALI